MMDRTELALGSDQAESDIKAGKPAMDEMMQRWMSMTADWTPHGINPRRTWGPPQQVKHDGRRPKLTSWSCVVVEAAKTPASWAVLARRRHGMWKSDTVDQPYLRGEQKMSRNAAGPHVRSNRSGRRKAKGDEPGLLSQVAK
nr:hypothetical protein CFP56_20900 [Quercus suber]